ncbi:MAG: hypothetical protein PUD80_06100 [Firmicutes bacterium]|nr:hypothetical protein [Bacillota bacterium]
MTFSYFDYLIGNLILPVLCLAFISVPVFRLVQRTARQIARGEKPQLLGDYRMIILLLVMLAVGGIMISFLLRGGIHLVYERPRSAVSVEGTIEEIDRLNAFQNTRYIFNDENSNGYRYTVGGVTCTGIAKGTLNVGDMVTVTYLPKSGFILSISPQG